MEKKKLITLKLIGFNEAECNNLHAILTLADRALKKKWQVVTTDGADFFLFSVRASATGESHKILKDLPVERCMFCTTTAIATTESQTTHSLLVDERHLPRLSGLVTLFNRLSAVLNSTSEINSSESEAQALSPAIQAEISTEQFFDPQKGLLGHLLATEHQQLIISLNAQPPLYIDVEKNAYYSQNNLAQLDSYLATPEALSIQFCSKEEIGNYIAAENLKPRPLKDLIWYITINTSAGKVIKGYSNTDIVALKSWPDLRLFKCLDYAKVATFMKNNAASLEIIAEQTKIPLTEVNNFYNACYLMGLIEHRNKIEINRKNISPERLDLLTKIDARLK